jgi:hypothetical protein
MDRFLASYVTEYRARLMTETERLAYNRLVALLAPSDLQTPYSSPLIARSARRAA